MVRPAASKVNAMKIKSFLMSFLQQLVRTVKGPGKMTKTDKIITIARRYCSEGITFWASKYSDEKSGNNIRYSENDYNIFPRYNALVAILKGVETIVGKSYDNIDQCKNELKSLGQTARHLLQLVSKTKFQKQQFMKNEISLSVS